jgi:hypothetical protein
MNKDDITKYRRDDNQVTLTVTYVRAFVAEGETRVFAG